MATTDKKTSVNIFHNQSENNVHSSKVTVDKVDIYLAIPTRHWVRTGLGRHLAKLAMFYIYSTKLPSITVQIPCSFKLVQIVVGVRLHPALPHDPLSPVFLDLIREGPKPLLQCRDTLLRLLSPTQERYAREPSSHMIIVHAWRRPADERTLVNGTGKRLNDKDLDVLPEARGRFVKLLFALVGGLALE
jgi:hypothetical protein